ncbi:MAG: tRNA 2-thiocytidine(32) synthetase TtcA [Nitrospirota bacterium]
MLQHNIFQKKHRAQNIQRLVGQAIGDYGLIRNHDRILVALSGGKDSWTLLHILERLRERAPISFSLVAVTIHPGFPGFETGPLEACLTERKFEHHIVHEPINHVLQKLKLDGVPCSLCSRIRRGALYTQARLLGCTKIALGHHREDFIETLLLNMFYNGSIKAMSPLFVPDDGKTPVIRPLVYVSEDVIAGYADSAGFPRVISSCPDKRAQERKRVQIKKMLQDLEQQHPGIKANLLASLGRVDRRHLLEKRERENIAETFLEK